MAKNLELWYPANNHPWTLNQAWGVYNPAYEQFGFNRHNGIDIPIAPDKAIYCPVRATVNRIEFFPEGGGHQVKLVTTDKWNVGGVDCYVLIIFMHNESILVNVGDVCEVGKQLTIPDNTGFSTGPHTHFGCYRLNDDYTFMDKNDANGSFDPSPCFNGYYATNATFTISTLASIIKLLTKVVQLLQKKS